MVYLYGSAKKIFQKEKWIEEKTSVASLFFIYLLYISFLFIFYGLAQKTAKTLQYQGFSRLKKSVLMYKMGNL